jgi:YGGT family
MDQERVVVQDSRPTTLSPVSDRQTVVAETVRRTPSGAETARRVVVFIFGIIQLVIGLRIVLLLLGADRANALVRGIYDVSAVLIAPFEGILKTDAIGRSGSVLDVAALVALVGWTVLELVVIAAIGIARREP